MHCVDCNKTHPHRTALIPSPFQPIIARESMPTASETAAIRDFVQNVDTEIAQRELAIHRLHCEVAELRRRAEQHKAIIAPIQRVPPEIMAEIFLQLAAIQRSLPRYLFHGDNYLFQKEYLVMPVPHVAPLIFAEISRKWRAVALSIPSLWNCISLKCTDEKMQNNISLCSTWLERSGALPLSFQFYRPYTPHVPQEAVDRCQGLLKTILPFARRWRLLDLKGLPASSYDILHDLLPNSVPMLEIVSISHSWEQQPAFTSTPWAGLRTAPKLRFLYFDSIGQADIMVGGERPTFPWSQLTHIDVEDCSAYDCLQILGAASAAVACRFEVDMPSSLEHPPVSHSGLRTLRVQVDGDLSDLWSGLTCPLLSTLAIQTEMSNISFDGVPSFIARCGATIEKFTLGGSTLDDTQFMACLSDMPQLRHLRVYEHETDPQFTDEVWESLTWRPDSQSPLIPGLERLNLDAAGDFSHKAVARMLESRVQTSDSSADFVQKLKTVELEIRRNLSRSACRRLTAFGEFGLDIDLEVMFEEGEEYGSEASDAENEEPDEVTVRTEMFRAT